jgi:CRP-like cAMP-binding protein
MTNSALGQNLVLRAALLARHSSQLARLKFVPFDVGQPFWKEQENLSQVFFPLHGVLSLQISAEPLKKVEIGLVGREGFAGVSAFLGDPKARTALVALTPGEAAVMPRQIFEDYLRHPPFRDAASRYVRSFVDMLARISVCNRVHVIEDLCVARLLLMQDRTRSDSFQITQDFLSRLLGVRRATISRAASRLQSQGAIRYDRRGRLSILDRARLEKSACSCYRAIKADFDRFVKAQGGL